MDDANEINAPALGPGSEEEHVRMTEMVEAIRVALLPFIREDSFGEDLAVALGSTSIYSGMLFGIAISCGLETATEDRLNQMGQMLCANFDYGIRRAIDTAAGGMPQGSA